MVKLPKETVDELLFKLAEYGYDKAVYEDGDFLLNTSIERDVRLVYDKHLCKFGVATQGSVFNTHSHYIDVLCRDIKYISTEAKLFNLIIRRGKGLLGT